MLFADVVLDIANTNVDKTFEYIVPGNIEIKPGMRVYVPFGRVRQNGFVIKLKDKNEYDIEKLKPIISTMDSFPVLTEEQIKLAYYIQAQYHTTLTYALRFMMPSELRRGTVKAKQKLVVRLKKLSDIELLELRESCISKEGKIKYPVRAETINKLEKSDLSLSEVPKTVLDYLKKHKLVDIISNEVSRKPKTIETGKSTVVELTEEQKNAVVKINDEINAGKQKTILLHGVTGSGKTEVYLQSAEHTLKLGKKVIILVPEIALTPQLYSVFFNRFGDKVAILHSGLSAGERFDEWKKAMNGDAEIVLGARSAIFAPLHNIGLIIIDEEHESSYKAENYPSYHAFEIANMRAKMNDAVLLLGSATPLVESYLKAKLGIYELIELKNRIKQLPMPDLQIVDMRNEFKKGNPGVISGQLYRELKNCLNEKKQAILFINRRGYASSVQCKSCGHIIMCEHCDIPMKYHRRDNKLKCHYCGREIVYPKKCSSCGERYLQNRGIGTEQVEEQLKKMLPNARLLRMDYDTTRKKNSYEEIYEKFKNHEADILIGTQMIAKGLDFDDVTLAAIISADLMANSDDYRADERMFSMIEQVGGRAGRKYKGKVLVQAYDTENYVIKAAQEHDYKGFYSSELERRRTIAMPPYSKLFRMVFSNADAGKAESLMQSTSEKLKTVLEKYSDELLLFTAKAAPVEKIQDKYRFHILIKVKNTKNTAEIKKLVYEAWEVIRHNTVEVSIDVNPYETV